MATFTLTGHVIGTESHHGLAHLRVELWDSFYHVTSVIASVTTTSDGSFSFSFTDTQVHDIFGSYIPLVFFKVYDGSTLKINTDGSVGWTINASGTQNIFIHDVGGTDYVVNGFVESTSGHGIPRVMVELRDTGHAVSTPAYSVETDTNGYFQYAITTAHLTSVYGSTIPPFYFRVVNNLGHALGSTEGLFGWNRVPDGNSSVVIAVPVINETYTITGHMLDASTGLGVSGLHVEAWDARGTIGTPIATADGGASGTFTFTLTDSSLSTYFGTDLPRLYFKVYSGITPLVSTLGDQEWDTYDGSVTLDITIPAGGGPESGDRGCGPVSVSTYSMKGTISSPDRAGMAGLEVRVYDKGIGGDHLLATGFADICGNFKIDFDPSRVADRGKLRPDIQIKVYSGATLVASSEVRYNAFGNETINVDIPTNPAGLKSEHEVLLEAILPHYDGALGDLQEDDDRQDITFLANKSGWDARAVAMATLADQFSTSSAPSGGGSAIHPSMFYALFRAGLPANQDVLFHTDEATLTSIWNNAIGQGMIPAARAADIPAAVTRFKQVSGDKLLTSAPLIGVSGMSDMLTASGLNSTQRQQFTQLYAQHASNPTELWTNVASTFGGTVANRLQLDGKLAYLTLNNAPLMTAVRGAVSSLTDPLQLAQNGFHSAQQWSTLITPSTQIPNEIPGATDDEKRQNYAEYLAAQVRVSYPTASVAHMVGSGALTVSSSSAVATFLNTHQAQFHIGLKPVEQYIAQNGLTVDPATVAQVTRIQRVYQITPDDTAMAGLLNTGLDAAAHVARYDKEAFVATFAEDLGGETNAAKVHDRSVQIHNAVLNVALSYVTASRGIPLGTPPMSPDSTNADSERQLLQPGPKGAGSVDITHGGPYSLGGPMGSGSPASDIPSYPTLESLIGEMDFCSCDECRSVLSPAAYLVDLLNFIDNNGKPEGVTNPQEVLFNRRPDIQHLPLTCENTNTALPYIDIVNEVLEYFVANTLTLTNYLGHDTGTMKSEDLLASPAFVVDAAYATLRNQRFPLLLPFHQPLENLRRHFRKFDVPLTVAMETLRPNDNLERGSATYGWRDILMEELGISRGEYDIFTNISLAPLWAIFGFATTTSDADVISAVTNAKAYCRRVGISYEELTRLLRTRFINPSSDLLPKLERLGVPFSTLKALYDGTMSVATFNTLLPTGAKAPDPHEYGGNIATWVTNPTNFARIMSLILLTETSSDANACGFDTLELRKAANVASPGYTTAAISAADHLRIMRFIRLWKKLGWTIEQTDAALCALYRTDFQWLTYEDVNAVPLLDNGFMTLLPRLGVVVRAMRELNLTVKRDLQRVLAWWSLINPTMSDSIYAEMFLSPTILMQDGVYADQGYGNYLADPSATIAGHTDSLRAAIGLTSDEFDQIMAALGYTMLTPLNIQSVTAIFRRGHLARALQISVRELLLLMTMTGIDPFSALEPTGPGIMALIKVLQGLRTVSIKPATALWLFWNQDLSGSSGPSTAQINEFLRSLREDFISIDNELAVVDDPTGEIAQARMTLTYGTEATDFFFSLLNESFASETSYSHFEALFGSPLAGMIEDAGGTYSNGERPRLAYDDFNKRLTYTGMLTDATRLALRALPLDSSVLAHVPPGSVHAFQTEFPAAIDALYNLSSAVVDPFFARYAELLPMYVAFRNGTDPIEARRTTLLLNFVPTLVRMRKYQKTYQRLADAAQIDRASAESLVNATPVAAGLHAEGSTITPGVKDLMRLQGLGLDTLFLSAAGGYLLETSRVVSDLTYGVTGPNLLPPNTPPGAGIHATWSGWVNIPETAAYTFFVDTESSATVTLKINGKSVPMVHTGGLWHNADELPLNGGTMYAIEFTIANVVSSVRIQWQRLGHGLTPIPANLLYPSSILGIAGRMYMRFLKASALATMLRLTTTEVARPMEPDGTSWLNVLPVLTSPIPLNQLVPMSELLDYAVIKATYSSGSTRLLEVMNDLAVTHPTVDSLLKLTGWSKTSLDMLVTRFNGSLDYAYLSRISQLRKVFDAFDLARTMGISPDSLVTATTNEPGATTVRDLQASLRARFSAESWREAVRPINDAMRGLQRDALVAHILHKFYLDPTTRHINTPEKLFEYFLMDVEMEPCMQTSRVRHALSTVQLFIERCLMSLEHNISSASISAKQWAWMKRYRVWEANRKVFLFPENWLEPELRDDKSPFFKEIESELLQSDITEESATIAMLNYVAKLEEVAKLEPVAFHHIPADPIPVQPTGEIDHVVARTSGAHRKYYYRRREYGYWTPWEQIKLDIEDNPVVPVVWNNRLLLLWLKILKSGPDTASGGRPSGKNAGEDLAQLKLPNDPLIKTDVVLCWSEYFNGKWQAPKTSDLEHPATLGSFKPGAGGFDRRNLIISTQQEGDGLRVNVFGSGSATFLMYNTYSTPSQDRPSALDRYVKLPQQTRQIGDNLANGFYSGTLSFTYGNGMSVELPLGGGSSPVDNSLHRTILHPAIPFSVVLPTHPLADQWNVPFFYQDKRHVFFVTSKQEKVFIRDYSQYGITARASETVNPVLPQLVVEQSGKVNTTPPAPSWTTGMSERNNTVATNASAVSQFVTEDANIHSAISTTNFVPLGGRQIGPVGTIAVSHG